VFLALTAGQRLGLALVAGLFIVFALASSFLLPRRNPDFPGRRLPLFLVVTGLLFVSMVAAMFVLAVEAHEETRPEEAVEEVEAPVEPEPVPGDPEAGSQVFAQAGCGGCHTFDAAGAAGTIAPDLDEVQPTYAEAVEVITNGRGAMPAFRDQLSADQIHDVAAFVTGAGED
jgi:cytochrome c6